MERDRDAIRDAIRDRALSLGFDAVGFAEASLGSQAGADLAEYLARGYHGDMGWLAAGAERRAAPDVLWPDARSVIAVAANYAPHENPLDAHPRMRRSGRGTISAYARNRDYHDVMKKRLRALARWIHEDLGAGVKLFVDTAPVMEKPLAQRAGLGWQGKHTNLVSRSFGSWLFLGEVYTDLALAPDEAVADHCGSCRKCQDVCPTNAFPEPYKLDARRCVSYLTIEHKGHIDPELREGIGHRIYGCDDCLAVCPWNKFATPTLDPDFLPRLELTAPRLSDLAALDDAGFRKIFSGSAIKRIGRDRFVRNVLIAMGNSGDARLAPAAERLLGDAAPVVRAMAVWALSRLLPGDRFAALRARRLPLEPDPDVAGEWTRIEPAERRMAG
ncbi:MAG: tRNA epoxyqueuosine(34) reductase QueG [Alphaproteobacteria bacterium]